MSLIHNLRESPKQLSISSKFTVLNGALYLSAGGLLIAWPGAVQTWLFGPAFEGREESLIRVLGMAVAIIGCSMSLVVARVASRLLLPLSWTASSRSHWSWSRSRWPAYSRRY